MTLLDTDHLTVLMYGDNPKHARLTARMEASGDQPFAASIISVEEHMRGWMAEINRFQDGNRSPDLSFVRERGGFSP